VPAEVDVSECWIHEDEATLYSQREKGSGLAFGLSEYSPPKRYSELIELHKYPFAIAGGPEGSGRPVKGGDDICQVVLRSSDRK
jgi:hypothetical protein